MKQNMKNEGRANGSGEGYTRGRGMFPCPMVFKRILSGLPKS